MGYSSTCLELTFAVSEGSVFESPNLSNIVHLLYTVIHYNSRYASLLHPSSQTVLSEAICGSTRAMRPVRHLGCRLAEPCPSQALAWVTSGLPPAALVIPSSDVQLLVTRMGMSSRSLRTFMHVPLMQKQETTFQRAKTTDQTPCK